MTLYVLDRTDRSLHTIPDPNDPDTAPQQRTLPTGLNNENARLLGQVRENVLVLNTSTRQVWRIDPGGANTEGANLGTLPTGLGSPAIGTVDFSDGTVYLLDDSDNDLWSFSASNNPSTATRLRALPSDAADPVTATLFDGALYFTDADDDLWQISVSGSDTEGTARRNVGTPIDNRHFGDVGGIYFESATAMLMAVDSGVLFRLNPGGADTEGTSLGFLPVSVFVPGSIINVVPYEQLGATFTGGLDGTLAAGISLRALSPPLVLNAAFTGDLDGTLAPAVIPGPWLSAALTGGLDGTLAPNIELGALPGSLASATFTGDLDGTLAPAVIPGPWLSAALTGGLDGTLAPGVALGPLPRLVIGAAFTGGLAGTLAPVVALSEPPRLVLGAVFTGGLVGTLAPRAALGTISLLFPGSLPQAFRRDGFRASPESNTVAFSVDQGPAKRRRRYTIVPSLYSGSMLLTPDQWETFKTWYLDTIDGGATDFLLRDPLGSGTVRVRFTEPPRRTRRGGNWDVRMSLRTHGN